MESNKTIVCVKKVKDGMPEEEWDESMPLPGDIIESISATSEHDSIMWTLSQGKDKSILSTQLKKLSRQGLETVWVRVRRGDSVVNLRARVALENGSRLHRSRRYTLKATGDDRHVAVISDLTLDQCTELQEMTRRVVNIEGARFEMNKGASYDWKKKVGTYLPDRRSTVISSIFFMQFPNERNVESTTTRCMAWFSAAVSSGAPLIFVNIQTEQVLNSEKSNSPDAVTRQLSWRERNFGRQQSPRKSTAAEMVQGIRLWYLPGISELSILLTISTGETRFGMDIKRTDEGFICIKSVSKGSASDRAGLRALCSEASEKGHIVVISRLDGKCITPASTSSDGLIHCCDQASIRDKLAYAIDRQEDVSLHIMTWSNFELPVNSQITNLVPPNAKTKLYV